MDAASSDASARKEVPRTAAQQIRRTRLRSGGSWDLSMTDQLPLLSWLSISALSAWSQAGASEDMACLRVLGEPSAGVAAKAQPVDLPWTWRCARAGLVRSAALDEERRL
eukprot:140860-Pleurochrysis_carterae.AAC.3